MTSDPRLVEPATRTIPDDLLAHYLATRVVDSSGQVLSDADGAAAELDSALWILTAWNPWSRPTHESDNTAAQLRLRNDLRAAGLDPVACDGHAADLTWAEPAWAVSGASGEQVCSIARAYGQYAVFCLTPDDHQVVECATGTTRAVRPRSMPSARS